MPPDGAPRGSLESPSKPMNIGMLLSRFLELIRFSHTVFALPFALLAGVWALSMPPGCPLPPVQILLRGVAVVLCMVFARSAAMAFNRLVDADLDQKNPRTAGRHLPAGLLSGKQVWSFFGLNCLLFLFSCLLFLPNWLPIAGALPVLAWVCGYSLAKRFTSAAHLWLGSALALAPICAWLAIRGELVIQQPGDLGPALALAMAIACWVAGFDIIYACQDEEYDRCSGLHSIPARLGTAGALRVAACFHLLMLIVLGLIPLLFPALGLGFLYAASLVAVAALVIRQHTIVRPDDLRRVGEAFFTINAFISLGFCTLAAIDACWP